MAVDEHLEKLLHGEAQIARVRLAVIALGTCFFLLDPRPDEIRWLAAVVLVLAWIYGLALSLWQPYHRGAPLLSSWVSTWLDLAFSTAWIAATGGFESRWYDLYYLGLAASGFRFGLLETAAIGMAYAGSYALLLAGLGELAGNEPIVLIRVSLVVLMGATCSLLAGETLSQIRGREDLRAAARAAEEAEQKLTGIMREAPVPMLLFDGWGRVERWNAAAEDLLGGDGRIPESLDELLARLEPDGSAPVPSLAQVFSEARRASMRMRLRGAGADREVQVELSAHRDADGALKGLACAFQDLTARANAEKERMRARMQAEEEERARISRELQEEVGQILSAVRLTLERVTRAPEARGREIEKAREHVNGLITRVRHLSQDLRPAVLDDLGLLPAIRGLVDRWTQRTGIGVDLRASGLARRFPAEVESAAYRILQEALENVARHSGARSVAVGVWADDEALSLSVDDEGRGFDDRAPGPGIAAMRDRAEILGGTFALEASPGAGTRVSVSLPLDGTRAEALS